MSVQKPLHQFTLPSGVDVTFRELGMAQMRLVMRCSDEMEQTWQGLRLSIIRVADTDVTADDLAGEKLGEYFTLKELMLLSTAWAAVHLPTDDEVEALKSSGKSVIGGLS